MRIKLITVISLILIAASGCQKKSPPAAADAETTAVPVTEIPMAETPTGLPLSEVKCCPLRSQIQIDATNPGGSGNLGDVCVYNDGVNSAGTALTWNWLAPSSKKFRVT